MELVDRYLFAVGRYLPKGRRADILAELRANILALAEDREQELGRSLTLEEEEAILKQHGHPMLVAARYLPQQYLIGPAVFPFYLYVMKFAFPWVLLLYVIAHAAGLVVEPITVERIVDIVLGFVPVAFYSAAWITLVFALMEFATARYMKDSRVLYAWSPRKLPVPEPEIERHSHPIFDFIGSLFTLAFLLVVREHPFLVLGPGIVFLNTFRPAPVWITVYEIAIVFVSVQLVFKFFAIFSAMVRQWRVAIDLATKAGAIVIIAYLIHAKEYVVLAGGSDTAALQKAVQSINKAMYLGWKVLLVILSLQLLWEVGKRVYPRLYSRVVPSHFFS